MTTLAYIRKSVVNAGSKTLSWEMQEAEVRALAARYGDDPVILSDWGKSGRKGADGRPGYKELLEKIEAGGVTAIYAYSLSRLSRSLVEYSRLAEYAMQSGVKLRLAKEGEIDFSSASGRLIVNILAAVAQMEAELAQERTREMVRIRRARGDQVGRALYGTKDGESLQAVLDAYEKAGSLHGAAKLLATSGVPTRLGRPWRGTSVRAILKNQAPWILPARPARGVAKSSGYRLARLLRCHCGAFLSPHSPGGGTRYWCLRASDDPNHGSPKGVSEKNVLPWVQEEIGNAEPPVDELAMADDLAHQVPELLERKRRLGEVYLAGLVEDDAFREGLAELEAQLAMIDSAGRVARLGEVDWDAEPRKINEFLRSLIVHVQLDPQMRPVDALWAVPWRRPTKREEPAALPA